MAKAKAKTTTQPKAKVKLLAGGNPQIAMADGNAPVQAYIAALQGWKRPVGKRIDTLIERSVPGVHKAVKWNSPLYGIEGKGFFVAIHVHERNVKLAFFRGASLQPLPPGPSKTQDTRYLVIEEGDAIDETRLAKWLKQAAKLPGFLAPRG